MDCSHPSRSNLPVRGRTEPCQSAAPARLVIRTCAHLLDSGVFCNAPARHGRRYCRHHVELGTRCGRMARCRRQTRVRIPVLQDLAAVRVAWARVRYALAAGHMAASEAELFCYGLRMAADNLRYMEEEKCWQEDLEMSRREAEDGP